MEAIDLSGVFPFSLGGIVVIVIRTLVIYFALLIGIRVSGKRELGQMTPFDLVVVLVISNAVQNAMVGQDSSITGGLTAAGTLLIVNWLVNRLGLKWIWLQRQMVGTPTLLIHHGSFIDSDMLKEGISRDEVLMALREHGIAKVEDADLVVLEVDGTMSVVPMNDGSMRTKRRLRGRKPIG